MAVLSEASRKVQETRARCLVDKQFLSEVLGYDFIPAVHAPLWNQFFQYDENRLWAKQSDIAKILILWPRGHYKACSLDTPIPTPSGFKNMVDVQVGDTVFDETGRPCNVTGTSPVYYDRPCCEVEFSTGDKIVCDEDHLWLTDAHKDIRRGKVSEGKRQGRVHDPSVKTTKEIARTLTYGKKNHNHSVPVASAVQIDDAALPIHPYVLGCWLGDGTSAAGQITIGNEDKELVDRIAEHEEIAFLHKDRGCGCYRLGKKYSDSHCGLQFVSRLRKLGILNNKCIPEMYLWASIEQRLELLRGLLDTDGSVSKDGQVSFTNTNKALVECVRCLIASLGFKPGPVGTYKSYVGPADNKRACGAAAHVVTFYAYRSTPVFHLTRKFNRQSTEPASRGLQKNRQIVAVRSVATRPVKCLMVDSPSHLYLCGEGYIPTHNTTAVIVDIIQAILNFPDIRILIIRGSIAITKAWLNEIRAHFTGRNPNSTLAKYFPEFCTEGELGNAMSFTVPARHQTGLAQATVTVASPNSIKTGTHYDIIYADDLVNDQNYRSPTKLAKVQQDFFACMPLIDPPFFAVVTGTRYAFGDVYENIMRANIKGEWRVSFRTCWADDQHITPLFPQQAAIDRPWIDDQGIGHSGGKLVGFTKEQLDAMQASDAEMFASQYLNQPIQRGGQRFTKTLLDSCKVKWIGTSLARALPVSVVGLLSPAVFFIDLASTDSIESDDSCIIVGKHDLKMTQYVVEARGGRWLPPMFAEQIINAALEYRPVTIYLEKTPSCMYFMDYLRLVARDKKVFLPLDYLKVDQKKDAKYTRIASLQGLMTYKKLLFFEGISSWEKIVHQFEIFPGGKHKHDDYIDTIALFATHMVGQMSTEPVKPRTNPIMEMVRQAEQQTLADQILERQNISADPSDGFDAFNSGWSTAQGSINIIPD